MKIGYVVKRYPRFSETFIVNEILAHEAAGLDVHIFSIRPCNDTHFQDRLARVRAPLTQLASGRPKSSCVWNQMRQTAQDFPNLWAVLAEEHHADIVSVFQAMQLAEEIRRRGINHLHAHFATLPATVARLAAGIAGITFSLTAHAKDIFHDSVDPADLHEKLADAAAVITVSQFNVAHLCQNYGLPETRVHRVYNGLDLAEFPFHAEREQTREIVAVGRLVEKKGFADLIEACQLLRASGVRFTCRIVGGGDQEAALRRLIAARGLEGIVTLTGPIPQAALIGIVRQATVLAAPCIVGKDGDRDGLPTVLLESMALGTPCVATPVTGIPEVIDHDVTGLLVPEASPPALAAALQRCLDSQQLRDRMARAARRTMEELCDADVTSQQIRSIFATCIDRRRLVPQEQG